MKMKMLNKAGGALVVGLNVLLFGLSYGVNANEWLEVSESKRHGWFFLDATVEAVNRGQLVSETSGKIKQVLVEENDFVPVGSVLMRLNDTQQRARMDQSRAQLQQAKTNLDVAQRQWNRGKELLANDNISQGDWDRLEAQLVAAKSNLKVAEANVQQAKENLSYTEIRAPYSGIVTKRLVDVGESVFPGKPLVEGLSLFDLRAEASLPQRLAASLGNQSDFKIKHGERWIHPSSVSVFPFANESSHSFTVRVDFEIDHQDPAEYRDQAQSARSLARDELFPGMWVKLAIPTNTEPQIWVPKSSVLANGAIKNLVVQMDGRNALRQVRTGREDDGWVEVLSGVKVGERIIANVKDWLDAQTSVAQTKMTGKE